MLWDIFGGLRLLIIRGKGLSMQVPRSFQRGMGGAMYERLMWVWVPKETITEHGMYFAEWTTRCATSWTCWSQVSVTGSLYRLAQGPAGSL